MAHDHTALYNALTSRDPRFDGVFYVGVTSTGIYCRPVCTAKIPKAANCCFFDNAESAEKANFRPCLRCRPELAPGNAPVDDAHRIAGMIAQRIDEGMLDTGAGVETIASQFGWSSRQIRRMINRELGVSPMELILTRRLLLAKQLLTETSLPMIEVAYASGFSSLRRFNDAFGNRYGMPPTRFRKATDNTSPVSRPSDSFTLQLAYRPPFDWSGMMKFLGDRATNGVESIQGEEYLRTVKLGQHKGWIRVRQAPKKNTILVELTHSLTPVLPALMGRLRSLFDLSARPDIIAGHLSQDSIIADSVERNPGLRVPGAFDGLELAIRAILGQQITVKGATTLASRFAETFGETIETPYRALTRLSPSAQRIAAVELEELTALGIARTRARSIVALAEEVLSGRLLLEPGAHPESTISQLVALHGIGPWTAQYIAMRALRSPDAFPKEDMVVRKALGGVTAARAEAMSQEWRPWRSYATLHLWRTMSE